LPALQQHFTCVWFNTIPENASGQLAIVPDGCVDLLWFDGALRIAGPDQQVKIECVPPGATVIGLRFRPGAATRWLEAPVCEVVDARVSLECFWAGEVRRLSEWIGEASSPEGTARRLEDAMAQRATAIAPPDETARAIFNVIARRRDYSIPVARELSEYLEVSERTLRRRCHETFGFGPKTLDRIVRFQRFLRLVRADGVASMADLAVHAGYSDQSHLSRETASMAGMTPRRIREQLNNTRGA
jgi:AraC-like DNA-binding protein